MNPLIPVVALSGEVVASSLSGILGDITDVLTSAVGWVGTIGATIADTPILLIGLVLGFVGFGVGLFRRLFHMR